VLVRIFQAMIPLVVAADDAERTSSIRVDGGWRVTAARRRWT